MDSDDDSAVSSSDAEYDNAEENDTHSTMMNNNRTAKYEKRIYYIVTLVPRACLLYQGDPRSLSHKYSSYHC